MSRYIPKQATTRTTVSMEDNLQAEATAPVKTDANVDDNDVNTDALTETPVEKLDSSKSPEALSTHVHAEITKVKEGETDVDNAIESAEKIINISTEAMSLIRHQGALDRVSAQLLNVALEHAMVHWSEEDRLACSDSVSLEHFDGASAYSATEISMEGIVDKLSTAINNITLSMQKHIKDFFGMLGAYTPLLERLKKRAETIRGSIDNSRREDGLKEIKFAKVGNLVIDGKVPEPATLIKNVEYWSTCLNDILSTESEDRIIEWMGKSVEALSRATKDDKDWEQDSDGHWQIKDGLTLSAASRPDIFKLYPNIAKLNASGVHGWSDDNFEFKKSHPLMGNMNIVLYQHRANAKTGNVRVEWAPGFRFDQERGYNGEKVITALTSKQQMVIIDRVIKELDMVLGFWKGYKSRNEKVMRYFQDVHKTYREVKSGADWLSHRGDVANEMKSLAKSYKTCNITMRTEAASNLKGIASTLIDYVEASRIATQANVAGQQD